MTVDDIRSMTIVDYENIRKPFDEEWYEMVSSINY